MGARAARVAAVLAVAVLSLFAAVPASQAYSVSGTRWPGKTISYANEAPLYAGAFQRAVRAWNSAKVGIRFVRAPADRARVVFQYAQGREGSGPNHCEGISGGTAPRPGYPGFLVRATVVTVQRSCRSAQLRSEAAAHELGHVLGLGHEFRACALMNAPTDPITALGMPCGRRAGPRLRRLRRQLVLHDDRAGARAIYRRPFARIDGFAGFSPGNGALLVRDSGAVAFVASAVNPALQYTWDFGDPDSGADDVGVGAQVSHAYSRVGYYPVTLSVTDGGAVVARRTQWVTVDGPAPPGGRR